MDSDLEQQNGNGLVPQHVLNHNTSMTLGEPSEDVAHDPNFEKMLELIQQQQARADEDFVNTFLSIPENLKEEFVKQFPLHKFVDHALGFHKEWEKLIGEYKEVLKIPREMNAKERDEFYQKFTTYEENNEKMRRAVNEVLFEKLYPCE